MQITYFYSTSEELVGFIPTFLREDDPRPAAEQFNERYAHGGGWQPMKGWAHEYALAPTLALRPLREATGQHKQLTIKYPGDPTYMPIALIQFRKEKIWIYRHAWVAIESPAGSVEIARMD